MSEKTNINIEELKEKAKVAAETVTEKAGEAASYVKQKVDEAGGPKGISEKAAENAGKAARVAHNTFEKVASSDTTQKAVNSVKKSDFMKKVTEVTSDMKAKFDEGYNSNNNSSNETDQ
ncbi:MAG: hypothetical protein LBM13_02930 [Candidatus Ancillula sp.]|jgi:hypothetical protein|nr:hypothetical protein [Candidatus Ancillula sp.]